MKVSRITVVWSTGARFQYASMVKQSSQDARAVDVINFIDQFVSILQRDPYSKIGKHHHKLNHSGQRKGGYSCGFPSTSNGEMPGLRFTYEVYDLRKGGTLSSLPHYVLVHVSADDVVNSDYIVFIQDAAWDYHDTDADSKRLKHRDSNDLPRELVHHLDMLSARADMFLHAENMSSVQGLGGRKVITKDINPDFGKLF